MTPFRTLQVSGLVFGVIGMGLLGASAQLTYQTLHFIHSASSTAGTVIAMSSSDGGSSAPIVQFTPAGGTTRTFTSSIGTDPPLFVEGESLEVFYNPMDSSEARVNTFEQLWFTPSVFAGLGMVFLFFGLGFPLFIFRTGNTQQYLKESGYLLAAEFQEVAINRSIDINGRSPFRIIVQWQDPDTKKIYIFESRNIWFNPEKYVDRKTINVYVSPGNPKNYYVDVSFLPDLAT